MSSKKRTQTKAKAPIPTTTGLKDKAFRAYSNLEKKGLGLFLSFILPALLLLLIFRFDAKGDTVISVIPNADGQQIAFFQALRRSIWGDSSLLYTFSASLGTSMAGAYAYYLASPLSFLVALFPANAIGTALRFVTVIKCGLAGLSMGYYLTRSKKTMLPTTVIGACLYALSSFSIMTHFNVMWADGLIFLPLLILGLEKLVREKKFLLFTVSFFFVLASNFHIGISCAWFVLFYYFYLFLSETKEERNPSGESHHFLFSLLRLGVFSLIAGALALSVLLPGLSALSLSGEAPLDIQNAFFAKFPILQLLTKLFPSSYDVITEEGLPFLYCGVTALLLVPLFFLRSGISFKRRAVTFGFLIFFLLSFLFVPFCMMWHGFLYPAGIGYRFAFLFVFLLVILSCEALDHIEEQTPRSMLLTAGFLLLLTTILQKFDFTVTRIEEEQEVAARVLPDISGVWLTIFAASTLTFIFVAIRKYPKAKKLALSGVAVLVAIEACISGVNVRRLLLSEEETLVESEYVDHRNALLPSLEFLQENAKGSFYRMENLDRFSANEGLDLGYSSLTTGTVIENPRANALLGAYGFSAPGGQAKYLAPNPVLDSIFGVRYLLSPEGSTPYYTRIYTDAETGIRIYENGTALSLAFGAAGSALDLQAGEYTNPFARTNALLRALSSVQKDAYLVQKISKRSNGGFTPAKDSAGNAMMEGNCIRYQSSAKNDGITFTLTAERDGVIYAAFPSTVPTECNIYCNNRLVGTIFQDDDQSETILSLGEFEEGEVLSVKLAPTKDTVLYLNPDENFFYTVNDTALEEIFSPLLSAGMQVEKFEETSIEGTISLKKGQNLVVTSIPYDSAWSVKLDGDRIDTVSVAGGFLAFSASEGDHEIRLQYAPAANTVGNVISGLSLLLLGGAVTLCVLWKKQKIKSLPGICHHLFPLNKEV